jgi:hypothetical protein
VEGVILLGLGVIAGAFAWSLRTLPPCTPYSDCRFDAVTAVPQLAGFAAVTVVLGLASVIGTAAMRRTHRLAWWLTLGSQLAILLAIIVPVARDPYEIGWVFLAVFPMIGLGLLLHKGLRSPPTSV